MLKKANPRSVVLLWKQHITDKYKDEIYNGNIRYFLIKDYKSDIGGSITVDNEDTILEAINRLRNPIQNMGEDNQKKAMKYIQNLTKISELYN